MDKENKIEKKKIIKKAIFLGAFILVIIAILVISFKLKNEKSELNITTLVCIDNSAQEREKITRTLTFENNKLVNDEITEKFYEENTAIEYEEKYIEEGKYKNIIRDYTEVSYTNSNSIFLGEELEYVKKVFEMTEEYDEINL